MTEVLVPYIGFDSTELANDLYRIAQQNKSYLQRRGYHGFARRYSGELALASVQKGQRDHAEGVSSHFAIVQTISEADGYRQQVVGTASIQKGLPLYKVHSPLPPAMAERIGLREKIEDPQLTHNIGVIIDRTQEIKGHRDELAYQQLVQKVKEDGPEAHAWMLIPEGKRTQSERYFAAQAGLGSIAVARFDDLESSRHIPPVSGLYVSE